jgi:glycosyltransferase involved in cell wall biosynthesis
MSLRGGSRRGPLNYALVTPARNEAENLLRLGASLAAQTIPPAEWIVVDDGSTDGTGAAAGSVGARVLRSPAADRGDVLEDGRRGGRDVVAFLAGIEALAARPDVVLKLDADVSLEPDFFARLLAEFERDPSLGISGGTCWERADGEWRPYHVTRGHVRGATRAYRWECLHDVLPLEQRLGWDVVDEIRAQLAGWSTRAIRDLPFYHHRTLGQRDGSRRQWEAQADLSYFCGYRPFYVVLRALWRAPREPTALAMIPAYAAVRRRGGPRAEPEVRAHLRRRQSVRELPRRFVEALGRA